MQEGIPTMNELFSTPHRRYNPLAGEWVKVSPHRTKRPWQGQTEAASRETRPAYDPSCYLCPGNDRAGGEKNPQYPGTYSFVNDFAAILPDNPYGPVDDGLFQAQPERGICKVLCFSPRHDLTIPRMSQSEVVDIIRLWLKEYRDISTHEHIKHIQIFENHGSLMGCSNPHPHGQIWAENILPDLPAKEDQKQQEYYETKGTQLLMDYLQSELGKKERIIWQNDFFVALVPFWAVWPYEAMILPKTQVASLLEFSDLQIKGLAECMIALGIRFDNLFKTDFPYSMGLHQAPVNSGPVDHWTFHIHYFPPLLRSAEIKKFMVGYEMMAMPQRDITPETSAEILRSQDSDHYLG